MTHSKLRSVAALSGAALLTFATHIPQAAASPLIAQQMPLAGKKNAGNPAPNATKPAAKKPRQNAERSASKNSEAVAPSMAPVERTSRTNRESAGIGLVVGAGGGFVYKTLAGPLAEVGYNLGGIGQVAV